MKQKSPVLPGFFVSKVFPKSYKKACFLALFMVKSAAF
jgi:hypothetical protein